MQKKEEDSKVSKEISSVVRRLRFMRVKDEEFYRQQFKSERQRQRQILEWHAPEWEDAEKIYQEQKRIKRLGEEATDGQSHNKKISTQNLCRQGRRSYQKANLHIENYMRLIESRISKIKKSTKEQDFDNRYKNVLDGKRGKKKSK